VENFSEKCWLEMGVLTVTFFGYIMADGKFAIDM
jgi:hypothetical protein